MSPVVDDDEIAREIVRQCLARGPWKSICPSEVARALADEEPDWRGLMPDVRRVADVLCAEGRISVMQRGEPVTAVTTKGPIRLSLGVDRKAVRRALRHVGPRQPAGTRS